MNRVPISDFPLYSVDELGNVYRDGREAPLAPSADKDGYHSVYLSCNGKTTRRTVHRLTLEAFIGLRPEGFQCCHLDGNRSNNVLSNLKWGSRIENESHKAVHGTKPVGVKNGQHRLTEDQVLLIRARKSSGLRNWGAGALAREFGVHLRTVYMVSSGRQWTHIAPPLAIIPGELE